MFLARRIRHPCRTLPCLLAYVIARPSYPVGYYGQGIQFPFMPNPNWMSVREQMLQHQLLQERQQFEAWRANQAQPQPQPPIISSGLPIKVEDDVEIFSVRSASAKRPRPKDQAAVKALKCARSASTSRRSLSPRRDYPRGTRTATRPSQASPKRAQHRPAQDLEAFKADITCCQTCFNPPLVFASQFKPSCGSSLCLHRMWLQFMRKAPRIRRMNYSIIFTEISFSPETSSLIYPSIL